MGNTKATLTGEAIKKIRNEAGFTVREIEQWHDIYQNSCKKGKRYLTDKEFKGVYTGIYGSDAGNLSDQIFRAFDIDGNGKVDFHEFMVGLGAINSVDNEKKLEWAFKVYDINHDGQISKAEMLELTQAVYKITSNIVKPADVDTPQKLTNKIFKKIDTNGDGFLSWEEFREGALDDPLVVKLLEVKPDK